MHSPFSKLTFLLATACCATAQSYPALVEIDLVFPRNETYAPTSLMPVALAFRNPAAWIPVQPQVEWSIYRLPFNDYHDFAGGGSFNLTQRINVTSDPYILDFNLPMNATEGPYMFVWALGYGSCQPSVDASPDDHRYFNIFNQSVNIVDFTIKNGGQSLGLPADPSCPSRQGFALNVVTTRVVDDPTEWPNMSVCGQVATRQPQPSPCALRFDAAASSSLEAALTVYSSVGAAPTASSSAGASSTAAGCGGSHPTSTGACPPSPTTSTSVGTRVSRVVGGATLWILAVCMAELTMVLSL